MSTSMWMHIAYVWSRGMPGHKGRQHQAVQTVKYRARNRGQYPDPGTNTHEMRSRHRDGARKCSSTRHPVSRDE